MYQCTCFSGWSRMYPGYCLPRSPACSHYTGKSTSWDVTENGFRNQAVPSFTDRTLLGSVWSQVMEVLCNCTVDGLHFGENVTQRRKITEDLFFYEPRTKILLSWQRRNCISALNINNLSVELQFHFMQDIHMEFIQQPDTRNLWYMKENPDASRRRWTILLHGLFVKTIASKYLFFLISFFCGVFNRGPIKPDSTWVM
jgi:hypothetical protein